MTWTWACKKKSNDTYHGRLNARGFEQIAGKHVNPTLTIALVTNDTTVKNALILMLLVNWTAVHSWRENLRMVKKIHGIATGYGTTLLECCSAEATQNLFWFEASCYVILAKATRNKEKYWASSNHSWPMHVFL